MKPLGIVIGHTEKRQGAYSRYLKASEYTYNGEFAGLLVSEGIKKGIDVVVERRDNGGIFGAYERLLACDPAAIIELHFNAATPRATGTETLHTNMYDKAGFNEQVFAQMIQNALVGALCLRDRGVKRCRKGDRGFYNLMQTKKICSIITEPFFGSNDFDSNVFNTNRGQVAANMIDAFAEWRKGLQ